MRGVASGDVGELRAGGDSSLQVGEVGSFAFPHHQLAVEDGTRLDGFGDGSGDVCWRCGISELSECWPSWRLAMLDEEVCRGGVVVEVPRHAGCGREPRGILTLNRMEPVLA
ncbi:hypothetical protein OG470_22785 [Micromonospora sp. NBC_00389]|uniref:hypothetical protein n=1 Tax=Micromonospora sp. NBC_00389 TaxID=2903586 RepID=UPI002E1C936F